MKILNFLKPRQVKLSRTYFKEVRELCEDLTKNTPYKDLKVSVQTPDSVIISGSNGKADSIKIDMDFAKGTQTQIEKTKSYVLMPFLNVREEIQEIWGTINGAIKRVKTTNIKREEDWSNYIKTTDIENYLSGNKYRMEVTPSGKRYFKNINGDWVEMFSKAQK